MGIHILTEMGNLDSPDIWFPSVICNQIWEFLNILENPKTLPHTKLHIKEKKHTHTHKQILKGGNAVMYTHSYDEWYAS